MTTAYEFGYKFAVSVPAISEGTGDIVAKFDVNALIDSMRQFPNLVHTGEPGFAESFQNPATKEMLWRTGAALPLGLSAAGLWALGSGRNDIKPLPPKQPVGKKKKPVPVVKSADWQETLQNVKAQLPGLHPVDTAVGAVGGAALGGLYDVLRGNSGKLAPNKRWKSTARRVLGGALLGGGAANLAGDRARRYISNTLLPFGYNNERLKNVAITPKQLSQDIGERWKKWREGATTVTGAGRDGAEDIKPDSLSKVWNAAVLDKPTYAPDDLKEVSGWGNFGGTIDARREIMRRTFGVHANNANTDWWQKNKGGYYSLNEQNPDYEKRLRLLFGPEHAYGSGDMSRFLTDPQKKLTDFNTKLPKYTSQARDFDFFAGGQINGDQQVPFAMRGPRIDAQVLDRFDLTPNPDEQQHLKSWLRNTAMRQNPGWGFERKRDGHFDYGADQGKTNNELAKTIGSRWLWENVLSNELPWISQKFTMTPNTEATNGDAFPWALQFLRENGQAAGPKINTMPALQQWLSDNPLAKEHEILTAIREAAKQKAEKKSADMTPRTFGAKIALDVDWKSLLGGAARGGVAGSALGGLHGLISPGQEEVYDEHGQSAGTKQRNRFAAGLRGAFWGGLGGAGLGAGADYVAPGVTKSIHDFGRRMYTGKTQPELNKQDNVARMPWPKQQTQKAIDARFKHMRENPTRLPPPKYTPPAYPRMELEPEPWETASTMTPDEIARSEDANL